MNPPLRNPFPANPEPAKRELFPPNRDAPGNALLAPNREPSKEEFPRLEPAKSERLDPALGKPPPPLPAFEIERPDGPPKVPNRVEPAGALCAEPLEPAEDDAASDVRLEPAAALGLLA